LIDGVKDGFLINPTVVDARTNVTTKLLSKAGFVVTVKDEEGEESEETFKQRQFEKKFFSPATNQLFCKTFLENGLRDPVTGEFGKSIVFAVSQSHAAKLTGILNDMANRMFPQKYQSDFAVQVTSLITDAQQFTINFANNNLLGSCNFNEQYKTSKARVCVTVGMMTTGYDCPDILNLGLFRPIFSPTDFIQIKGRGTRKHDFREQLLDLEARKDISEPHKKAYKLFDFFANCEYFEEEFNYDEVIKLPRPSSSGTEGNEDGGGEGGGGIVYDGYQHLGQDLVETMKVAEVGPEGMKIDRMFFEKFQDRVKDDRFIAEKVESGQWDQVIDYVNREVFGKPDEYYTLDKLRRAAAVDRRLTLREILEKVFGMIPRFKSKDELLEDEFNKFVLDFKPEESDAIPAIKLYFKAYVTSDLVRHVIDSRQYTELATNPSFSLRDFKAVPEKYRSLVPEYIKDYVPLNQFAA
jgi:type I restriction enzyme R subunit